MSVTLTPYSPAEVNVSWLKYKFEGFAEDTFIEFSRSSDLITKKVGAKGDIALTINADKSGEITMTFLQNSPTNVWLSGVVNAMEVTGANLTTATEAPLIITDPSGSALVAAKGFWIQALPDVSLGATDTNSKSWTFGCRELYYGEVPAEILQAVQSALPSFL